MKKKYLLKKPDTDLSAKGIIEEALAMAAAS